MHMCIYMYSWHALLHQHRKALGSKIIALAPMTPGDVRSVLTGIIGYYYRYYSDHGVTIAQLSMNDDESLLTFLHILIWFSESNLLKQHYSLKTKPKTRYLLTAYD